MASTTAGATDAGEPHLTFTTHNLGARGERYSFGNAVSGSVVVGDLRMSSGAFHPFAYDLAAAEPVMQDLGTLGGRGRDGISTATAVDGTIVVGAAETTSGERHAFAYDLGADRPVMRDLGTLGGPYSRAAAVDGTIVVGSAQTTSGAWHAFAYDLAADKPVMHDLGNLGGPYSMAVAVDGTIVVGVSSTDRYPQGDPEYMVHAFAYDLAAAEPEMIDLGTLGGTTSVATGVEGHLVVGWSNTTDGPRRAFAYDLAADARRMQDLGTLAGDSGSDAVDVDGGVVVGMSVPAGHHASRRAVAYDLAAPEPAVRNVTTLGIASSWATGVSDDVVVVGGWRRSWPLEKRDVVEHAFAHYLAANDPRTVVLGDWRGSTATNVDGSVVVGTRYYGASRTPYATAWVLRETTRPMLGFRRYAHEVKEGVGRVTVRVERYGRTDRAVTVRYRTRAGTATAGKDFVSTSGKLRFPAGVTSRSFTVKILNDRRAERNEDLVLSLSRPSRPGLLGSPSWSELRIATNDR